MEPLEISIEMVFATLEEREQLQQSRVLHVGPGLRAV
jgi:CMP-2-keto-3-deoxyoctulosonic acid synthetase